MKPCSSIKCVLQTMTRELIQTKSAWFFRSQLWGARLITTLFCILDSEINYHNCNLITIVNIICLVFFVGYFFLCCTWKKRALHFSIFASSPREHCHVFVLFTFKNTWLGCTFLLVLCPAFIIQLYFLACYTPGWGLGSVSHEYDVGCSNSIKTGGNNHLC